MTIISSFNHPSKIGPSSSATWFAIGGKKAVQESYEKLQGAAKGNINKDMQKTFIGNIIKLLTDAFKSSEGADEILPTCKLSLGLLGAKLAKEDGKTVVKSAGKVLHIIG